MKNLIAIILYYSGISFLLFYLINRKNTIRVINYHCTPLKDLQNFKKQISFFKKHFNNTTKKDLVNIFNSSGRTNSQKRKLMITFDDGLRSNYDFALKILEDSDFTGWFCIPVGFVYESNDNFARQNSITCKHFYPDGRLAMNEDEIIDISKNHEIVCHTYSHHRMCEEDRFPKLFFEIQDSKLELEKIIGKEVDAFAWVGGELSHYTSSAQKVILKSNFRFSFTTNNELIDKSSDPFNINRTNIESCYPIHLVLFQLSGLMDLLYTKKRNLVKNKFSLK